MTTEDGQAGTLVLRRSWEKRGTKMLARNVPWVIPPGVAVTAWSISAAMHDQAWASALAWPTGAVVVIAAIVYLQERGRLFIDDQTFGESWPWGKRFHPIAEVRRVRRVTRRLPGQPPWPHIVVLDGQGRRLLDIQAYVWGDADLDRFVKRLGVEPEGSYDHVVDGRQFNRLFPKR